MATPWTCASCRVRIAAARHTRHLQHRSAARRLSERSRNRQQQAAALGYADSSYGASGQPLGTYELWNNDNGNGSAVRRGRYSGKHLLHSPNEPGGRQHNAASLPECNGSEPELDRSRSNVHGHGDSNSRAPHSGRGLRPEELLSQLDQPVERQRNHAHARARSGRLPSGREGAPQLLQTPRSTTVLNSVPTNLQDMLDKIKRHVGVNKDIPAAWQALQELAHSCQSSNKELDDLPKHIVPMICQLLIQTVRVRLHSLTQDDAASDTPTPYQILLYLHKLQYTRSLFYLPILWHLASGLAVLRHRKVRNERISEGLDELMNIWRILIGSSLAYKSFPGRQTEGRKRAMLAIAQREGDWSFLPPLDVFSSWPEKGTSSSTFEQMFSTVVSATSKDIDQLTQDELMKTEYASAALVTLDLLRATPYKTESSQSCASAPQYAPFVNLLEVMLKKSSAPRVPARLESHMSARAHLDELPMFRDMLARLNCTPSDHLSRILERRLQSGHVQTSIEGADTLLRSRTPHPPVQLAHAKVVQMPNGEVDAEDAPADLPDVFTPQQSQVRSKPATVFATTPQDPATVEFATSSITRLGRAIDRQNLHVAIRLQDRIHDFARLHTSEQDALPLEVFEHLMRALLSLRDAKAAMETWHLMQQLGYKPTIKTYTAMMRGAQNARDVLGVDVMWSKIRKDGLRPDAHAWTIRLHALIKLRNSGKGLQALKSMADEWFAAARAKEASERQPGRDRIWSTPSAAQLLSKYPGPVNGVPRPTLEVINAVIAALATSKPEDIPKVLRFGRPFGIEPDLITYNTLLGVSMRNGNTEEALAVLQQMQKHGIRADNTTWTTLLRSLFDNGFIDDLSHEEQEQAVLTWIDTLESKEPGLSELDTVGYALIMNTLTKQYSNGRATAAVYSHMLAKGLEPTSHIYTIMMTSYFQRQPQPDFVAIENLWHQIQDKGTGFMAAVDTIFYDRMVEGYAANHHIVGTTPMEDFLRYCRQSGKKPGWKALHAAAHVYAERRDGDKLRRLVDQALLAMRDSTGGKMSRNNETEFWNFIFSTEVIQDEDFVARVSKERKEKGGSALLELVGAHLTPWEVLAQKSGLRFAR